MIINVTPHEICVFNEEFMTDDPIKIAPSGMVARVTEVDVPVDDIEGFSVVEKEYTSLSLGNGPLPEPVTGTFYIASGMALAAAKALGRIDFLAPDTGTGAVRKDGKIIGTTRLIR